MSGSESCRVDRLTKTRRPGEMLAHSAAWRHASCNTKRPIGTISPVSSATPTKSDGGINPRSGSFQRSSASVPVIEPDATSMTGW